tara:strand:- start:2212 stop:3612 length:1401 start_codon:yes stop_codon:yes gene_type:complete
MRKVYYLFLVFILTIASCAKPKLDTKLIAAKYKKSIVKVLTIDPKLEKIKPGKGYLGRGSGFFVTSDGYIFTNRHVVETCVKGYIDYDYKVNNKNTAKFAVYSDEIVNDKNFVKVYQVGHTIPVIQVFNNDNENDYKLYKAEVVSIGTGSFDGALLKVISDMDDNPVNTKFVPVPVGNSDKVSQGESLCVYGYPAQVTRGADLMLKDMSTLSVGIMSGLDFVFNSDYGYMKTDAEIHPGNSGGPVFNEENKVVGIATAKGNKTGIGLVGGINGMYYISAIDSKAHSELIKNGLVLPKRSPSINSEKGTKQSIKTLKEINAIVEARKPKEFKTPSFVKKTANVDYYKNSKIFFSNISPKENNNKLPDVSKRFAKFSMDLKNKGGKIWVYLDNYPASLKTDQIKVYIDKLSENDTYKKFKDVVYNVSKYSGNTYFSYDFYEEGTFKFFMYSKEGKYINNGIVEVYFKK